jgi:hypothetical protein
MPKLYDSADNRLLGEVSQDDIAVLQGQLETNVHDSRPACIDNETFLRLVEAGASSALLDAVKMALDRRGDADVHWDMH